MEKSKLISYEKEFLVYPRTIATLTANDFEVSFDNNSRNGEIPLTWLALVTTFNMTELEVAEWASLSKENHSGSRDLQAEV